jgi:hypothetical protein
MRLLDLLVALMDHPAVRAATLVISLLSLVMAYISLKKTREAVDNYWKNARAEHARFLERQWSDTYRLTMISPEFATQSAEIFGFDTAKAARHEAALLIYINICAMAFQNFRESVITREQFDAHMNSFFAHFKGDVTWLETVISLAGYDPEFRKECTLAIRRSIMGTKEMPP